MSKDRHLRTFERIAYNEYHCDQCGHPIFPGDLYRGEVWVYKQGRSRVITWRYHVNPWCPEDHHDEEESQAEILRPSFKSDSQVEAA